MYREQYLIVTVLSKIVEPSVAVVIPPAAAAAPPPVAVVAVEAVLACPFFLGRASAGKAESKKTRKDTTPAQDSGMMTIMKKRPALKKKIVIKRLNWNGRENSEHNVTPL